MGNIPPVESDETAKYIPWTIFQSGYVLLAQSTMKHTHNTKTQITRSSSRFAQHHSRVLMYQAISRSAIMLSYNAIEYQSLALSKRLSANNLSEKLRAVAPTSTFIAENHIHSRSNSTG
jgi:hypothetical protein